MAKLQPASPENHTGPVLDMQGVVKRFGRNVVLRGLDLAIASHEVVVLLGASGSGKSTLLRTANLLERVDDGQIFLSGADITDPRIDVDAVRARIGVVFQHYNLFPHLSVLDNITLAARKVHGVERGVAEARGRELLERIGLSDKARAFPDRLSGGQQQRVAIARALITRPQVIFADEPTGALDSRTGVALLEYLQQCSREQGQTIIMVTHDPKAAGYADRALVLSDGVIVDDVAQPSAEIMLASLGRLGA